MSPEMIRTNVLADVEPLHEDLQKDVRNGLLDALLGGGSVKVFAELVRDLAFLLLNPIPIIAQFVLDVPIGILQTLVDGAIVVDGLFAFLQSLSVDIFDNRIGLFFSLRINHILRKNYRSEC